MTPPFKPGYRGFLHFARSIGVELAPFQRKIANAVLAGHEREVVAALPRGQGKSSLAALLSLHHLLATDRAAVHIAASSRDQARICFEILRDHAQHPAVLPHVVLRHLEVRAEGSVLRVLASDGPRAHGLTSSFLVLDELWCHKDASLLEAFETTLVKRPDSRMLVISTAAATLDSPLGRMRQRALSGDVKRTGAFVDARVEGLHWLEWSLAEGASPDDVRAVKACNPAPWISMASLREQRLRCTPVAFEQFHCNRWGVGEGAWLPPGAWSACRSDVNVKEGTPLWIGIDIGGARASSALVAVTENLEVAECRVVQGDEAVLEITQALLDLAERFVIVEVAFDPWRYHPEALRLEREHGVRMIEFPQSHARLTAASENLHRVIVERKLKHPGFSALDKHIASAVAKPTGRGWKLERSHRAAQIDAAVSLAMCVERVTAKPTPVALLGWL